MRIPVAISQAFISPNTSETYLDSPTLFWNRRDSLYSCTGAFGMPTRDVRTRRYQRRTSITGAGRSTEIVGGIGESEMRFGKLDFALP